MQHSIVPAVQQYSLHNVVCTIDSMFTTFLTVSALVKKKSRNNCNIANVTQERLALKLGHSALLFCAFYACFN